MCAEWGGRRVYSSKESGAKERFLLLPCARIDPGAALEGSFKLVHDRVVFCRSVGTCARSECRYECPPSRASYSNAAEMGVGLHVILRLQVKSRTINVHVLLMDSCLLRRSSDHNCIFVATIYLYASLYTFH